jgi:DHA1 family bicyclomycin/chloramphenicol resistance-like MFS transporter
MPASRPDAATDLASRPRSSALLIGLLIALTALAPLSLQIFLPALPAIQATFGVTSGTAQLVLSLSILANAFAMLAYGPISDRFGRRPAVIAGLIAFAGGSIVSAVAPDILTLIFGRIVQAIGGAAGMVLARAMVRDLYDREHAARMIAYLTMAMVVAPMLAPTIGALLTEALDWRAIFWFVAAIGAVLTWLVVGQLVETHAARYGGSGSFGLLAGARALLRSPAFVAYVLQSTFAICIFFAFISGAPYFMINVLGRSTAEYGLYFIAVSAGFMLGNLVAARLSARVGLDRMILIGSMLALAAVVIALALLTRGPWHPLALFGPMTAGAFANGLTVPNAQAGAVSVDPSLAGTASGFAGFSQMFAAALVSQLVGMLQNGTPYPMVWVMTAVAALSLLGFFVPRRLAGLGP